MTCHRMTRFFNIITNPFLILLNWLQSPAALLARIWVSYVFLNSGILKLANWSSTLTLFMYEFHVPLIPAEIAAVIGTACEIILPILIIAGLGGRIIVMFLFIFNIFAVASYPYLWSSEGLAGLMQHINWGIILMLLMCFGTGKLTLDALLSMLCKRMCRNKTPETPAA